MGGVFANGLEISGKAVDAKTIAAMPDTCFTPPENPATPPGVPVPYPSFGMAGDTDKGTGTVKIGGKTVNIKNKSHLTKTTGTEAGSAAKKGIITSKNTGKEQFNSWSNDVKFDGEPVIRNTDMATNNHASPAGNTAPWVHIAKLSGGGTRCGPVLAELKTHEHRHSSVCENSKTGDQSEHSLRVSAVMADRKGKKSCGKYQNYKEKDAPCICMNTTNMVKKKAGQKNPNTDTPHTNKTQAISDWLKKNSSCKGGASIQGVACVVPTVGSLMDESIKQTVKNHKKLKNKSRKKQKNAARCLRTINLAYVGGVDKNDSPKQAKKKVRKVKKKKICAQSVCSARGSDCCHCGAI